MCVPLGLAVTLNPDILDNDSGPAKTVWGLYGVRQNLPFSFNADLYYLGLHSRSATYDQGQAEETRHSFGTRIWGKKKNLDY